MLLIVISDTVESGACAPSDTGGLHVPTYSIEILDSRGEHAWWWDETYGSHDDAHSVMENEVNPHLEERGEGERARVSAR
jgi:hypothetical protein